MSAECCGPDEAVSPGAPLKIIRAGPPETGHEEFDACCGPTPRTSAPSPSADGAEPGRPWWRDRALLPSGIAGAALLLGYILEWSGAVGAATPVHAIALLAGASTFVPGAARRLLRGRLGVGLLMTIAAIGAVLLGHVGEAAALAFLFSLAEALEDRAMGRAKESLGALLSLLPENVRIEHDGSESTIAASEVRIGHILVIGAGERVATDALVVSGHSSVDASAVTGESIPLEVGPRDQIPAGVVNGAATLRARATADGRDNSLTQIVALVQQAHARKGSRARLADRIARPLVPVVLIAAAMVAAFGFIVGDPLLWVERALVVLVAASPCALAIAVPVTVISAIGTASKLGVVIKSGAAFEELGSIRTIALDKTGTLTRNEPRVVEVVLESQTSAGFTRDRVLNLTAAVERSSSHPLADALVRVATVSMNATSVEEHAGCGIVGDVDGSRVRVGNERWVDPGPLADSARAMTGQGMSVVVVEIDGVIAAVIGIRDELRPEAAETIVQLRALGITPVMVTGDNSGTAEALAKQAGIGEVRAGQLPAEKAAAVTELSAAAPTAMVGDGINDAPALATADVGIAMGVGGSAAAIEAADIAFTGKDLRLLPRVFEHARRGRSIMTVNIALAIAIILVLFPLALFGVLGLAGVVLVHEIAELVVIANGVRAARLPNGLSTRTSTSETTSRLEFTR